MTTVNLPLHTRSAAVRADTFDPNDYAVDVVFTTGADVLRSDWMDGTYIERLLTGPENVRLERLNSGAAFLDTHNAYELGAMIGSVVKGSARMESGQGRCRVQLSRSDRAADTVNDIRAGIINNISVGYNVLAFDRTEATGGSPAVMTATLWEPVEISAVPVPADPGAQATRARAELHPCTITRNGSVVAKREAGYRAACRLLGRPVDEDELAAIRVLSAPPSPLTFVTDVGKRDLGADHWRGALALPTGSVDDALGALRDHWREVLSTPGGPPIAIDPKKIDGYQPIGEDDESEMAAGAAAARIALGRK